MSGFETVVELACTSKATALKQKYLDPIVAATWSNDKAVHDVCNALLSQFHESNSVVAFKALIVLHTIIQNGATDSVLGYLSTDSLRLCGISAGNCYKAPGNLQNYAAYLDSRIQAYSDLKHDAVHVQAEIDWDILDFNFNEGTSGSIPHEKGKGAPLSTASCASTGNEILMGRKLRVMTVEEGLLSETKAVYHIIEALVECRFYLDGPVNELAATALRMLVKDFFILLQAGNDGATNVLERYYELSHGDVLDIYERFRKQAELVVEFFDAVKQLQNHLGIPIPDVKHALAFLAGQFHAHLGDLSFEESMGTVGWPFLRTQSSEFTQIQPTALETPGPSKLLDSPQSRPHPSQSSHRHQATGSVQPQQPSPSSSSQFHQLQQSDSILQSPQQIGSIQPQPTDTNPFRQRKQRAQLDEILLLDGPADGITWQSIMFSIGNQFRSGSNGPQSFTSNHIDINTPPLIALPFVQNTPTGSDQQLPNVFAQPLPTPLTFFESASNNATSPPVVQPSKMCQSGGINPFEPSMFKALPPTPWSPSSIGRLMGVDGPSSTQDGQALQNQYQQQQTPVWAQAQNRQQEGFDTFNAGVDAAGTPRVASSFAFSNENGAMNGLQSRTSSIPSISDNNARRSAASTDSTYSDSLFSSSLSTQSTRASSIPSAIPLESRIVGFTDSKTSKPSPPPPPRKTSVSPPSTFGSPSQAPAPTTENVRAPSTRTGAVPDAAGVSGTFEALSTVSQGGQSQATGGGTAKPFRTSMGFLGKLFRRARYHMNPSSSSKTSSQSISYDSAVARGLREQDTPSSSGYRNQDLVSDLAVARALQEEEDVDYALQLLFDDLTYTDDSEDNSPAPGISRKTPSSPGRGNQNLTDDFAMALALQEQEDVSYAQQLELDNITSHIYAYDLALIDCPVCMESRHEDQATRIPGCEHPICNECLTSYVQSKLEERRYPIVCPTCLSDGHEGEPSTIGEEIVTNLPLAPNLQARFTELRLNEFSVEVHCRGCRRTARIDRESYQDPKTTRISCPLRCKHIWCKQCGQTVKSLRALHTCDGSHELESLRVKRGWRRCPRCTALVEKTQGCNHITCPSAGCNSHFCYKCGKEIIKSTSPVDIADAAHAHAQACG